MIPGWGMELPSLIISWITKPHHVLVGVLVFLRELMTWTQHRPRIGLNHILLSGLGLFNPHPQ